MDGISHPLLKGNALLVDVVLDDNVGDAGRVLEVAGTVIALFVQGLGPLKVWRAVLGVLHHHHVVLDVKLCLHPAHLAILKRGDDDDASRR